MYFSNKRNKILIDYFIKYMYIIFSFSLFTHHSILSSQSINIYNHFIHIHVLIIVGVIWLVRNRTNYVNESKYLECSDNEDTGKMETFVNVISARSAIGHDGKGRVVLARVDGQTHVRG